MTFKPGDHPAFFQSAAPEGRSRESTLRLDRDGQFWHEGEIVAHPGLAAGMHTWLRRHPDDRRFILSNGYDWTYVTVDDAPYFVQAVKRLGERLVLTLSDGTDEAWDARTTRTGPDGALYVTVKAGVQDGPFEAKFTRLAQQGLAPHLEAGLDGRPGVRLDGEVVPIG